MHPDGLDDGKLHVMDEDGRRYSLCIECPTFGDMISRVEETHISDIKISTIGIHRQERPGRCFYETCVFRYLPDGKLDHDWMDEAEEAGIPTPCFKEDYNSLDMARVGHWQVVEKVRRLYRQLPSPKQPYLLPAGESAGPQNPFINAEGQ
ncbi:MAG: hypothetical protein HY518_02115 [Candidatus Aenigmarchaeota archaeon]|nr:hypothetical protein [Candidatus Aenigmarchaeota archaeon]